MNLAIGDSVKHQIFSIGKVVDEWGMWIACRHCYAEYSGTKECTCKKQETADELYQVSGRGIFDVKFASPHGLRSINKCWLRKLH